MLTFSWLLLTAMCRDFKVVADECEVGDIVVITPRRWRLIENVTKRTNENYVHNNVYDDEIV